MRIEENVLLADHTTFKIGGPAELFVTCESVEDVQDAVALACERGLAVYPLGEGSNVLASDEAITKAVLRISIPGIEYQNVGEQTHVTVGAGVSWDTVVNDVTEKGLWGLENLAGIPGTIGGAAVQNIGAYGAVFEDTVISIEAYDTVTNTIQTFSRDECNFSYRMSIFKQRAGSLIVTRATLALSEVPAPHLGYRDIEEYFANTSAPTLVEIRNAVRTIRAKKFPNLSEYGTAGSFFLNPVLPEDDAARIAAKYPGMPLFPMPEGGVKVPIAWLLDYRHGVLDMRDMRVGKALVWPIQPLVLASEHGATASEVNELATLVRTRMKEATGIDIQREVQALT